MKDLLGRWQIKGVFESRQAARKFIDTAVNKEAIELFGHDKGYAYDPRDRAWKKHERDYHYYIRPAKVRH